MKTEITDRQIETYCSNGFLAIEGFLSPSELGEWRDAVDDAVRHRLSERGGLTNQTNPEDFYAKVFTQCIRLADTHAGVARLMLDESIGRSCAALAGIDGIRVWHDQALIKPPHGNPTAWHLDCPYWSFSSRDAISIWIALDDATLANGCMWYLPGTHKTARFENSGIGVNINALFKVYPKWLEIDPVPVPVAAGTAVVHNGLCAHGAGANMTNKPRRAMTCAFMPDGSTFNGAKNILPDEYFNTLKIGDVLNDQKQNPLIWSRNKATAP